MKEHGQASEEPIGTAEDKSGDEQISVGADEEQDPQAGADEQQPEAGADNQQDHQAGGLAAKAPSPVEDSRAPKNAGMLGKKAASKREASSKLPPSMANLSLVLPRPLVRPSQAGKKVRKNLQASSGKKLQANSNKNSQAPSRKNLQATAGKKIQVSSGNLQPKSSKKTNVQRLSKASSGLANQGKENQSIECISKSESNETLGEDLELDLRKLVALRKSPMTNSERQLLQLDHKTDWTLWEESCLAD